MSESIEPDALFALLRRIGPFPEGCLLIGSCAVAVYRRVAGEPARIIVTKDADILLDGSRRSAMPQSRGCAAFLESLRERLVSSGEYRVDVNGPHSDEVSHVLLPVRRGGFKIEILASVRPFERGKKRSSADHFGATLRPQILSKTNVLLTSSWHESLADERVSIRVPNPLSFLLQKAEIRAERSSIKQDSDAAQVLTIARIFQSHRDRLQGLAVETRRVLRAGRWKRSIDTLRSCFGVAGDPLRGAIRALSGVEVEPSEKEASQWIHRFLDSCGVA